MNTMVYPTEDDPTIVCTSRTSIERTAEERLRSSGYLALRDVACIARDDMVYLDGRLPSHFLKQTAQEIVAGVEGVRQVINRIDVLRPARPVASRSG
jgi:osmotically-inducible protein OsmY